MIEQCIPPTWRFLSPSAWANAVRRKAHAFRTWWLAGEFERLDERERDIRAELEGIAARRSQLVVQFADLRSV
jgi:hypothetical protein